MNREWALLCDSAAGRRAVRDWAAPSRERAALSELLDVDGLHAAVRLLQSAEVTASGRDVVLVALLGRAQDGDGLAGRIVLQTMLPAAVRIARAITSRPDVLGDQDEAFARAPRRARHRAGAYSPLGRGLLTGAITAESSLADGDSRRTGYFPRSAGEALRANLALVDEVSALAGAKGCTPGQLALAWVLAQGPDVVPIPGTKRVRYLEQNVGALAVHLSEDELVTLTAAVPRSAVMGDRYGDMSHIDT